MEIHADRTQDHGGDSFISAHNNEDGGFHTYRIAHDSTKAVYHVWRDGERLSPIEGAPYDLSGSDDRLILGDYSGSSFGNEADLDIDYVAYDQTDDYLPPGADTDGDGLPDAWEYLHFNDLTAAGPDADADGDGLTNQQEFIADTDPDNRNSRLRAATPVETTPNTWSISVPDTSPDRYYSLYATEDLSGPWTIVPGQGPIPGNGGTLIFTETATSAKRFFRVEASIP